MRGEGRVFPFLQEQILAEYGLYCSVRKATVKTIKLPPFEIMSAILEMYQFTLRLKFKKKAMAKDPVAG